MNNEILKGIVDYIMANNGKKKKEIHSNKNYRGFVWNYREDLLELYDSLDADNVRFLVEYLQDRYSIYIHDILQG